MPIACLSLEIAIEAAHSLKERRQVFRSLKDRLRYGFNVSVAEMDEGLLHNRLSLAVVSVSPSHGYIEGQMKEVERAVEKLCIGLGASILESSVDIVDEPQDGLN